MNLEKSVLFILFMYVAAFAFMTSSHFMDDAYISLVYARNLANGHGLVFFPGLNPTEGITNFGWVGGLSLFSLFVPPTLAAKGLGAACIVLTFYASTQLMTPLAGSRSAAGQYSFPIYTLAPALLLASNFDYIYLGLSGMETSFLAALLLAMVWVSHRSPASFLVPTLAGFAFWVRPEAGLVFPIYFVLSLVRTRRLSRIDALHLGVWLALVLAITAFRWFYFGALLPNTFAAKTSDAQSLAYNLYALFALKNTNLPFPYSVVFLFCLSFIFTGARRAWAVDFRATAGLIAITVTGVTFALYAREDWTALGRYFAPYLPAFLMLLWLGLADALASVRLGKHAPHKRTAALLLIATGLLISSLYTKVDRFSRDTFQDYPGYVLASRTLVEPSVWISANTPVGSIIATRRIGCLAYFSKRRVFDYKFGLPDPRVTALIRLNGDYLTDPNHPLLEDLWQKVRPDYILEDESELLAIATAAGGDLSGFEVHGIPYREVRRFPIGRDVYWVLAGANVRSSSER